MGWNLRPFCSQSSTSATWPPATPLELWWNIVDLTSFVVWTSKKSQWRGGGGQLAESQLYILFSLQNKDTSLISIISLVPKRMSVLDIVCCTLELAKAHPQWERERGHVKLLFHETMDYTSLLTNRTWYWLKRVLCTEQQCTTKREMSIRRRGPLIDYNIIDQ